MSRRSVASVSIAQPAVKRKIDDRIKILLDDAAKHKHRSVVVLVGDRNKEQIVNFHTLLKDSQHSAAVSVLWCMKDEPLTSGSKRQAAKQSKLEIKGGVATEASNEKFETFKSQTNIRFCQYKDSHRVLGNTFGMAILQDFEALTPNILARTIETVAGGGLILILLRQMKNLRQLYTMAMDVHSRYRTDNHKDVVPRFNERFLLSLCDCENMICVDDDLNVLPITNNIKNLAKRKQQAASSQDEQMRIQGRLKHESDLANLKSTLQSTAIGPLVHMCQTMDQAKTVLALMRVVSEKTLNTTCSVTAARGRGKSTALGIAVAGAIKEGYSNVFVTAPSPENLATFFDFVEKGLVEAGYKPKQEFEVLRATNPEFNNCKIRINVHREHRQTVQFISAQDVEKFSQAELLVIDEAAALPLPLVQRMMGPYLIFMASTISGYEGTGRSLSMKLLEDMRQQAKAGTAAASATSGGLSTTSSARQLTEIELHDPIRYGPNDPVEKWLTKLLCLDATNNSVKPSKMPSPTACELYHINRDALFSYHPKAEQLLQQLVSLFVAAHYKNQPNDLQLLSDAPAHHIFALCGPITKAGELPDIFCVIHACEEGNLASQHLTDNLNKGIRPSGDLIPYTIAQHYLDRSFPTLAGMRIVRIATNPELQRAGYGRRAMELFCEYYGGKIAVLEPAAADETPVEEDAAGTAAADDFEAASNASTLGEQGIKPRKAIPTLLTPITERPPEAMDYVGVSYGLTHSLLSYWTKCQFVPLYLRQIPNDLTGEHSCVMVRPLHAGVQTSNIEEEFRRRFIRLLPMSFRSMPIELAVSLIPIPSTVDPAKANRLTKTVPSSADGGASSTTVLGVEQADWSAIEKEFSGTDLSRLNLFATSYVDTSTILDLVPKLAQLYFSCRLQRFPDGGKGAELTAAQAIILAALGLQGHHYDSMKKASPLLQTTHETQLKAFFKSGMELLIAHFKKLKEMSSNASSADAEVDAEEEKERYDGQGRVVGMTVTRREKAQKEVDSTLLRDAGDVTGDGRKSGKVRPRSSSDSAGLPKKKVLRR